MDGEDDAEAFFKDQGAVQHHRGASQVRTFAPGGCSIHDLRQASCKRRGGKVALAAGLLLVASVALIAYHVLQPARLTVEAAGAVPMGVEAVEEHAGCAGDGESCNVSQCCNLAGTQCYEKNGEWAACKPTCVPGPDLGDIDATHWSCRELGNRTPGAIPHFTYGVSDWVREECSKPGEDCADTRCCSWDGMQCYVKNEGFAGCRGSCIPGPRMADDNGDAWACKPLGPRTPGTPPKPSGLVAKWVSSYCSGPNEDCRKTRCCSGPNVQCFEKNGGWAACKASCVPGPDKYDVDEDPWTCRALGSNWTVTTTTTTTTRTVGFPSLFCFSVARNYGEEPKILSFQYEHQTGIFGCDETAVFCTDPLTLGEGPDAVQALPFENAPVGLSKDRTAGNALLFMHVWDAVSRDGRWMKTDWTIKADPDAVIFPGRLRKHLAPHNSERAFVKTCNSFHNPDYPMMFGALEALSRSALETYIANKGTCDSELRWARWGEDLYLQRCLLHLGATGVVDLKLIGDNLCGGANCFVPGVAAFHPFKTIRKWKNCWGHASGLWTRFRNFRG